MFQVGNKIRYGQAGVCRIEEIRSMQFGGEEQDYYVLMPLFKPGSLLYVPTQNSELVEKMLPLLTAEQIHQIVRDVKSRPVQWERSFRLRSENAKKALSSGDRRDALYLIKTIYSHKKEIAAEGKRIHTTDDYFLKDAENLIYFEFSVVLQKEYDKIAESIRSELETSL